MKSRINFAGVTIAALCLAGQASAADVRSLAGSTTLSGVVTDAIVQGGLSDRLTYQGGGSGAGETALVNKQQALAPMSRGLKPEALASVQSSGFSVIDHVIALDGVAVLAHSSNKLSQVSLVDLQKIFSCSVTRWEDLSGSGLNGSIAVYVRDEASGTTDAFKALAGIKAFGSCVKVVSESDDIANATNTNDLAIGYAGLSSKRENNLMLAVSRDGQSPILPTVANIRAKTYPLSRELHIFVADGGFKPSSDEQALLEKLLDRSFLDPIVQDHGFVTVD